MKPPEEWGDDEWAALQADLDELELDDPVVRDAAISFEDTKQRIIRRDGDDR